MCPLPAAYWNMILDDLTDQLTTAYHDGMSNIYAIIRDGVVLYVGQSVDPVSRRNHHRYKAEFAGASFVVLCSVTLARAMDVEAEIIADFKSIGQCTLNKIKRSPMPSVHGRRVMCEGVVYPSAIACARAKGYRASKTVMKYFKVTDVD